MESSDPLESASAVLMADTPRISDAMKNYISYLGATGFTASDSGAVAAPQLDMAQLMTSAKIALKLINSHELKSSSEWAEANPQGDDESGSDRIEALTRYKAAVLLAAAARSKSAKVSKLLGREYLRATKTWSAVQASVTRELTAMGLPESAVEAFVVGWSQSVHGGGEAEDVAALVWSQNFASALQARQQARQQEVAERRERMDGNEDEATRLREALVGGAGGEEEEPRVVEVA